jgi:hypothetical protein
MRFSEVVTDPSWEWPQSMRWCRCWISQRGMPDTDPARTGLTLLPAVYVLYYGITVFVFVGRPVSWGISGPLEYSG